MDQGLVEGHQRGREAANPRLVAEGLAKRLTERDADILDGVVQVNLEVPDRVDGEVEAAVLPQLGEHVIEERDPG